MFQFHQLFSVRTIGAAAIFACGVAVAPVPQGNARFVTPAFAQAPDFQELMDTEQLDAIIRQVAPDVVRQGNQWRFSYQERQLLVVADPNSDRMRVIAPVGSRLDDLSSDQVFKMMVANFHTALDARYAFVGDGTVVAVFLHRLSSLQDRDLQSALSQVAELSRTFGTTYSSGNMLFGPGTQPAPSPATNGDISI